MFRFRFKICCIILVLVVVTYGKNKVLTDNEYFFPNLNKKIKVEKVLDEKTGKIKFSSNSAEIRSSQDLEDLKKKEDYLVRKKYGCLDRGLRRKYDKLKKKVKVRVVLKRPKVKYLDKTKHSENDLKTQSFEILNMEPYVSTDYLIKQKKIKSVSKKDKFFIETEMSKEELSNVMFDDNVACVEEVVEEDICMDRNFYELSRSAANPYPIALNPANPNEYTEGNGIVAATFETGLWEPHVFGRNLNPYVPGASINIANTDIDYSGISHPNYEHTQYCFSCLYYAAPKADLVHVKSTHFESAHSQNAIVSKGIQTASLSYTNSNDPNLYEHLIMDGFAYQWPYTLFCNPTGNDFNREVCWGNYNSISVGNVQHFDLVGFRHLPAHYTAWTSWINPPARYSSQRDREFPHLLAPGFHSDRAGDYWNDLVLPKHKWGCGTSYSAPTASGMAACVMSADWRMKSWPEKVRVALMLTAENIHGGYWNTYSDGQDGNGVISGNAACKFAINHSSTPPGAMGVIDGMYAASWQNTDFSDKDFAIKIPSRKPNNHHLRIVLTWDSNPDLNGSINHLSDLDLNFDSGRYLSNSWDSNVEVIDVPMNEVAAGSTYNVSIDPVFLRTGSMTYFYYAIGWTWVKDNAI